MKNVVVVGVGGMGTCIAYALGKLGYIVHLVDNNPFQVKQAHERLEKLGILSVEHTSLDTIDSPSVVISAATYLANQMISSYCIEKHIPYCDLGGDPDTTVAIHENSKTQKGMVFTDLGLAPGLINILAEYLFSKKGHAKNIEMKVGGLPIDPQGMLKYGLTWSVKGLKNEYSGSFDIIKDGEIAAVSALNGYETFDFPGIGPIEAFYTKGALSTSLLLMHERGVENFNYKTMRYPGHCELLKFMLEECKMTDEDFETCVKHACPIIHQDVVLLYVKVDKEELFHCVYHDDNWTAMQKATAFPAASIASLLAEGIIENKEVVTYKDVPFLSLQEKLNEIGDFPNLFK
jgi:saccharopine dehydrogenase-like NADP-dependent oxidoreductase